MEMEYVPELIEVSGVHVYEPVLGMLEAMVVTTVRALALPERSSSVIVPWSVGVHVMVVDWPAVMVPPTGEVMGLLLCAATMDAQAATAAKTVVKKRMSLNSQSCPA